MPLPAPYAPPWQRLGEAGVALLAWLGLKAREVWRRNRDGLLPVPAFWPRRWTRLFWPLVILAALPLAGGVGRAWGVRAAAPPVERAAAGWAGLEQAPPTEPSLGAEGEAPAVPDALDPLESPEPLESLGPPEPPEPPEPPRSPEPPEPLVPLDTLAPPDSPAEREARRLRAAWGTDPEAALLRDVSPDPANATLTLQLADPLPTLKANQRQRLADRWRDRAEEEGYSHLLLRDGSGRLWGRDALVGRGMILLDPPGPADGAP